MSNKHIISPTDRKKAICGQKILMGDWYFIDHEHAQLTIEQNGRLVPCEECLTKSKPKNQ